MYVYTDDDLTRINRDYLGPKGKRLPWVATYRAYGVSIAVLVGMFGLFMALNVPLSQWTALLYAFLSVLVITWIVRRMKRDVSIWAMARAGYQEVTVPRAARPAPKRHTIAASVQRWDYNAQPAPRWWERRSHSTKKTSVTAGSRQPAPTHPGGRRAARRRADH
ncbi:hypothetical protein RS84_00032 [Microbacterium hydrocarbonoxydans]|uniref:Uncharacterized protein n=1 Tax=Microbacterium hydrocarbonoxydans TaxID=273678 RepID=A0A0M2HYN6_9MICO|nr:hypothetical protein [Microbacterium hydrocarbonoxydans]KJL49558.1 hypothetical protein RS84_00032 [Microbacterium hydrocarbonoxydans]